MIRDSRWRRLLGLRAPHPSDDPHLDLPLFVERDKEPDIRNWMREAREMGGFLILVGNPCVGKTRLLVETASQELAGFDVLFPDPGAGGPVNRITETDLKRPGLIVWLNELHRFLPGPWQTDDSVPITFAAIRRLLGTTTSKCPPVVIVGAIWPDYLATLREPDPENPYKAHYQGAVDILTERRVHEIRLDTFSAAERTRANELAARDSRLATALADPDYGVTQFLAGARELDDRYNRATDDERAVLHAAIDARRVGIQSPLTDQLLCAAARGYSDVVRPDDIWFASVLEKLANDSRPQDKATAPLIPVPSSDKWTTIGHRPADRLLHQHSAKRRTEPIPGLTWGAFDEHTHDHADLARLADQAWNRLLYEQAIPVYQRLIAAGDETTARRLADRMVERDRRDILHAQVEAGDWIAARRLANLLLERGDTTEAITVLRIPASAGDWIAIGDLADLLVKQGRIDEAIAVLRHLAEAGFGLATGWMFDLIVSHGRIDALRAMVEAEGPLAEFAGCRLANVLIDQGRVDEAIQLLRRFAEAGGLMARTHLAFLPGRTHEPPTATSHQNRRETISELEFHMYPSLNVDDMLARQHQADNDRRTVKHRSIFSPTHMGDDLSEHELLELAEAGDDDAAWNLVDLLIGQDRVDEAIQVLRALSDAGYEDAADQFIRLLVEQHRMDEVLEALPQLASAGYGQVTNLLVGLLVGDKRVDDLRRLVEAGDGYAAWNLVDLLIDQDRVDEAIQVLQGEVETGALYAASQLVYLLASHNRVDELRELAEAGNEDAARLLADLLARRGGIDELRAEVWAGTPGAAERYITMLAEQGQVEMAERIRRFGLTPTGDVAESR